MNDDVHHLRLLAIGRYIDAAITALFACFPLIHVSMRYLFCIVVAALSTYARQTSSSLLKTQPPRQSDVLNLIISCYGVKGKAQMPSA